MEFIITTPEEKAVCDRLSPDYLEYHEGDSSDRYFLTSLILRKKPKTILELGVSSGASSVVILNAIRDFDDAKLYSLDYLEEYYKNPSRKVGFIVDKYPDLAKKWKLLTGGLASNFVDTLEKKRDVTGNHWIDFVFIDTMHDLPGEILDFLIIFPYLKEDCTVVLHDTKVYFNHRLQTLMAPAILISALKGKKTSPTVIANIGGITLNQETGENIWDVFNALSLPWNYLPTNDDLSDAKRIIAQFYEPYLVEMFDATVAWQKTRPDMSNDHINPQWCRSIIERFSYFKYCLLSKMTFGETKNRYMVKKDRIKASLAYTIPKTPRDLLLFTAKHD
jgi:hypothetical protein